jgi:hypothetical protein
VSADPKQTTATPVLYALRYAAIGWPAFPCIPGEKKPIQDGGFYNATTDPAKVRDFWRQHPRANVGLRAGPAFWVLDIDPDKGGNDSLAALEDKHGPLPNTLRASTPRGGTHHYFTADTRARCSTGDLAAGIDTRAAGGYVVAEGSIFEGRRYAFYNWDPLTDEAPTLAPAPEWLFELLKPKARKAKPGPSDRIPEGKRNSALASIGGRLRRAGLSAPEIEAGLLAVNRQRCDPPLEDDEVRGIAESVARYETGNTADAVPLDIFRQIPAPALASSDFPQVLAEYAFPLARAAGHDPTAYALAGLAASAGAIGDDMRVLLDSRTSWFESARLWILLLGAVGSAKTPAIRAAMTPLYDLHRELRAQYAAAIAGLGADDPKPPAPAVFATDATIEKLSEILHDNPRGIIAVFEELDTWLGAHDCYRGGQGSKDRGEWLRLYDGGPHQVDRIKRGSYFVPNWGASILGATTPAGLRRHAHALPPDGLIQRFLSAIVQPMCAPDDTILSAQVRIARERFTERLLELHAAPGGVVRLSGEAASIFFDRRDALREEVQAVAAFSEPLAGHVAKHAGLLGRVALAFHCLENGGAAVEVAIGGETMAQAVGLLRKLTRHALALFDLLGGDDTAAHLARALGRSIVVAELPAVTRRDLREICRAFKSATEYQREAAIRLLVDSAWLTPELDGRQYDGRPARLIVAPEVFTRFREAGEELKARRAQVREMFAA